MGFGSAVDAELLATLVPWLPKYGKYRNLFGSCRIRKRIPENQKVEVLTEGSRAGEVLKKDTGAYFKAKYGTGVPKMFPSAGGRSCGRSSGRRRRRSAVLPECCQLANTLWGPNGRGNNLFSNVCCWLPIRNPQMTKRQCLVHPRSLYSGVCIKFLGPRRLP